MKVISTNIGEKTLIKWRGKEVTTGIYKNPVNYPILLGLTDVTDDVVIDRRYHGGADKACYLYAADHYPFWKEKFPKLEWQWGMFGENITMEGLDESKIHIGDIYQLGKALVQISQPRQPCFKLGIRLKNPMAVKQFVAAGKPGAYVRVLESGLVSVNDAMELIERKPANFTLKEVFHLLYHGCQQVEQVKRTLQMPELAESCRNDLKKQIRADE
ncbi:MAG: MOSC domain-containing protein [Salinivirgaceae bacterium]|jgi:MOSC domain-containing protein YiiM